MAPLDQDRRRHATKEEICTAYAKLTDVELVRLEKAAKYSLWGTEYTDPLELVGEAIARLLEGADGEGGRHWPIDVEFMACMVRTIQSIADASQNSNEQKKTARLAAMAGADGEVEDVLFAHDHFQSDVVRQAIDAEEESERQAAAKADADLIDQHFKTDEQITWIIMGVKEDMKPAEIQELSGMSSTEYDSARRRFRRNLDKLMPGRRKT